MVFSSIDSHGFSCCSLIAAGVSSILGVDDVNASICLMFAANSLAPNDLAGHFNGVSTILVEPGA